MPDNTETGTGKLVATDSVTYSGDAGRHVQLTRRVAVTGAEDSKTVIALEDANGAFVQGNVAHDATDAGNPVKIGAKAIAHGANPTAVAAAERTDIYANRHGIPFFIGGHPNVQSSEYITTAAGTDDPVIPAVGAGTKIVITQITVAAHNANSVNTTVRIGFGTASVPTQGASQADGVAKVVLSHPGIAPGSGLVKGSGAGIVGVGGDGEDLRITNSVPTGGSIVVQVDWFTIES